MLCQEAEDAKANECAAMLAILERTTIEGALVKPEAIAADPAMARAVIDKGVDHLRALKRNQPNPHDEVASLIADPATALASHESVDKDHGRIGTRTYTVVTEVDLAGRRSPPQRYATSLSPRPANTPAKGWSSRLGADSWATHYPFDVEASTSTTISVVDRPLAFARYRTRQESLPFDGIRRPPLCVARHDSRSGRQIALPRFGKRHR